MRYHVVGIAGAGMGMMAHMLLDQGHAVSGSDMQANRLSEALGHRGARVYQGHDAAYIAGADVVLATSAVGRDHPELVAAQAAGIPVQKRADIWRDWSRQRSVIGVAGTHGKSTTTAMIALVLVGAGVEAGYLIGADVLQFERAAQWGHHDAPLVIEADEYDHTFLGLWPAIAVVTSMEWDHPDVYSSPTEYHEAFGTFFNQTHGPLVVSEQVAGRDVAQHINEAAQIVTYGLGEQNRYRAIGGGVDGRGGGWEVLRDGARLCEVTLAVPGWHNVLNALAALAVADTLSLDVATAAATLATFRGVARRFELKGEAGGVTVIDDYAHHPSEVAATLAAARARYGERRIVAYLQPHTFSRTLALLATWPPALHDADVVLVGAIYPSRERADTFLAGYGHVWKIEEEGSNPDSEPESLPLEVAMAQVLVGRLAAVQDNVWYAGTIDEAVARICGLLGAGDILITMGAGDGYRVGEGVLQALQ
jgi:UDP-N-acetylmuramate--alanine ligase